MHTLACLISSDLFRGLLLLVAAVIAVISIWTSRVIARKKQAADVLFAMRNDEGIQDGLACIAKHHDADDSNIRTFAKSGQYDSADAKKIRYLLNHYETISVGIQIGIYDEQMFKRVMRSTLVNTYNQTLPLIEGIRLDEKRKTVYVEFERLALRWIARPLKLRPKMWFEFWRWK